MGTVRFLLSLLVVGSHVGGMGGTPAGGIAIAGFFAISGFLMARTISENYRGRRALRFYLNRIIRLGPPLVAVMLLTWLAVWTRDARGFQHLLENGVPAGSYMPVELPATAFDLVSLHREWFPLYLSPSVLLLPQAWSVITESCFYLVAPLLVLTFSRGFGWLGWAVPATSLFLAVSGYNDNWLRSPFAAVWIFWAGMQAYFFLMARPEGRRDAPSWWAHVPVVGVMLIGVETFPLDERLVVFIVPLLIVAWLVLGRWHTRQSAGLDRLLGNISYGVFLGHYLSTLSMYWIAERVYLETGVFGVFGVPDLMEWRLRVSSFAFALLFGFVIYLAFERPFERLRSALRRRPVRLDAAAEVLTAVRTA